MSFFLFFYEKTELDRIITRFLALKKPRQIEYCGIGEPHYRMSACNRYQRDFFDGNESVQQETLEFCYCSHDRASFFRNMFAYYQTRSYSIYACNTKTTCKYCRRHENMHVNIIQSLWWKNAFIKVALVLMFNSVRYLGSEIATQSAANTTQRFSTAQHGGYTEFYYKDTDIF